MTLLFAAASLAFASAARAQSGDVNYPTPVFTNEVSARIAPRDIGDPRRTSHFYTFRGTEGDLTVTFDSTDLTGDVDVYTATTLHPLLRITLLGDAAHVTKGFYVRSEETLVLRVEARAVGDAEGSYRITFGGSFKPAPPELAGVEAPAAPTVKESDARGGGGRRVTSTGARVEEPAPPKEEAKEEPTPQPNPTPAAESAAPETPAPRTSPATRRGTGARAATRRTRPATPAPKPATESAGSESSEAKPEEGKPAQPSTETTPETKTEASTPTQTRPATRRGAPSTRRGAAARTTESARIGAGSTQPDANPPAAPKPSEPAPSQRLIITTRDGGMIERNMSTVRRVTVENSQVVIVTTDGKTIREPLSNVLKMSIEP